VVKKRFLVLFLSIRLTSLLASPAAAAGSEGAGGTGPGAADFASRCGGCHSTQPGKNGVGPSLAGIYGSASGTVAGYQFSPALKNANLVWDDPTLNKFLRNPSGLVHGTKMFVSVPDDAARQRIVTYLQTLKSPGSAKN
jgi:cytochrome c